MNEDITETKDCGLYANMLPSPGTPKAKAIWGIKAELSEASQAGYGTGNSTPTNIQEAIVVQISFSSSGSRALMINSLCPDRLQRRVSLKTSITEHHLEE